MPPTTGREIRQAFLDYFAGADHTIVRSAPLVLLDDPTLLFTGAGMVQFMPYFSGEADPPDSRLASVQKCFRTTDLEEVGDESHLTFFEMLGNFSIGDYFKEGAIDLAWEFVTRNLKLQAERIWITVYQDDDEAFELWRSVGIPGERILRFGKAENWWGPPGETGPCGPDSEIFVDRGKEHGCGRDDCGPNCKYCERYLELWNLVFMTYHQDEEGELSPLPSNNIDTGMGLERSATIMQGAASIFETDLFSPIVQRASTLGGVDYGTDAARDRSLRIVAEHSRAATFLLAEGVMPSNEGRGDVLRRLMRRAVFHSRRLGFREPLLASLAESVAELSGEVYPELAERHDFVAQVMTAQEERFHETLDRGQEILAGILEDPAIRRAKQLPGAEVFRLHDTYGLPVEFTREMAAEAGLALDEGGFQAALEEQKAQARRAPGAAPAAAVSAALLEKGMSRTEFLGYETLESEATVLGVGRSERQGGDKGDQTGSVPAVSRGEEVEVLLDRSPFYAEAGGQVGDTGVLEAPKVRVLVHDTRSPQEGFTVHLGTVEEGTLRVGDTVTARVDGNRRADIMRNHTATHLLHKALRETLGSHALQAGSLVAPDRLRFDFQHLSPLTAEELAEVERRVNEKIRADLPVDPQYTDFEAAIAEGAVALFGEKYGDQVRVVGIDGYSRELCGGTHLARTGQIGTFLIVGEEGIGAGTRRIEALTGRGAEAYVRDRLDALRKLYEQLATTPADAERRIEELLAGRSEMQKELDGLRTQELYRQARSLLEGVQKPGDVAVVTALVEVSSREAMRQLADEAISRLRSAAVLLGARLEGQNAFVAAVSPDLVERGIRADDLVRRVADKIGGSGGGRPHMAEGGGGDPDATRLNVALEETGTSILEGRIVE
ncbi:MAG: alanine--tRNA ligase [Anaerolineae bacterium]